MNLKSQAQSRQGKSPEAKHSDRQAAFQSTAHSPAKCHNCGDDIAEGSKIVVETPAPGNRLKAKAIHCSRCATGILLGYKPVFQKRDQNQAERARHEMNRPLRPSTPGKYTVH